MPEIRVNIIRHEDLSYNIYICDSEFGSTLNQVIQSIKPTSLVVVTDSVVSKLHLRTLLDILPKEIKTLTVQIPSGEEYKVRKTKEYIEDRILEFGMDRKGLIIALGGGVIGDVTGFVASTYMRGVSFIQVPTTLLAMIDSSIGGKVAVDTPFGKNMIGAFYQPKAVIMNIDFLNTLPVEHVRNGLAEVIKHAIISDEEFFYFLLNNKDEVINLNKEKLVKVIETSCMIKKKVVENDEKESGFRKVLNFGHTVGHAIESVSGYKILHGFAVSVGMVIESKISARMGILSSEDFEKIQKVLALYGLPTNLREVRLKPNVMNDMVKFMRGDKKSISGEIYMSLPKKIGGMIDTFSVLIEESLIVSVLKEHF